MIGLAKRIVGQTVFIVAVLLAGTTFVAAQQKPPVDVMQLVRSVIDNELDNSHQDQIHWMYRLQRQEADKATVSEVVETKNCDIHLLLALNGEALTPDQRQKEDERLRKLVNDPQEQQRQNKSNRKTIARQLRCSRCCPRRFFIGIAAVADPWSN